MKKSLLLLAAAAALLLAGCASSGKTDSVSSASEYVEVIKPVGEKDGFEIINAAIVGDHVLDISASLGVLPKVMSVRGSQWPKARSFPAKLIGCPVKIAFKAPDTLPKAIEEFGIDTVIIEKTDNFCLLVDKADPMKAVDLVKDLKVKVYIVDFTEGVEPAVKKIAKMYDKAAEGKALLKKYKKELAEAEAKIANTASGKKVVVLKAFVKKDTKKVFVAAESKGFYTDKYFLEPFGCENVSDMLNPDGNPVTKGAFPVTNFRLLADAAPDVIIVYGDMEAFQKKMAELTKKIPALAEIPAVKKGQIVKLPFYVGSDIEDYPAILTKWTDYFSTVK